MRDLGNVVVFLGYESWKGLVLLWAFTLWSAPTDI